MVSEAAFPSDELFSRAKRNGVTADARETTPGKDREVRWEVVAFAQGLAEAAIIQGRLETEGIPARVHQEPAGTAIGLTMGLLGQAKVLVPEPLVESALDILNQSGQEEIEEEQES